MAITLENTSKQILVFNLDSDELAGESGEHGPQEIKTVTVDHLPTGELIPRTAQKRVPSSLTLLAGEKRSGLPDAVQRCAQVKAALATGDLRVVEQKNPPPEERAGTVRFAAETSEKEPER